MYSAQVRTAHMRRLWRGAGTNTQERQSFVSCRRFELVLEQERSWIRHGCLQKQHIDTPELSRHFFSVVDCRGERGSGRSVSMQRHPGLRNNDMC